MTTIARTAGSFGIRGKLVSLLMLFGIIPALVIVGILQFQSDDFHDAFSNKIELSAGHAVDVIDRNLFERYGDVQAFGLNAAAHDPANWKRPGQSNPLVQAMNGYTTGYGIYRLMMLLDPNGDVLAVNSVDAKGRPVNTDRLYGQSFKAERWFADAAAGRFLQGKNGLTGTTVLAPQRVQVVADLLGDDGFVIPFSAQVRDGAGKVIGVWVNFADFALVEDIVIHLYEDLRDEGLASSEITILDSQGVVLVDYDPAVRGVAYTRDPQVIGKLNLVERGVEAARAAVRGESGATISKHARKGVDQAAGYAHSEGAGGFPSLGWSALVRVNADEIFSTWDITILEMLIALAVAAVAIAGGGMAIGSSFSSPIRGLTKTMEDLAAGDLEVKVAATKRKDEIGAMTHALETLKSASVSAMQAKVALGRVETNVMIADNDLNIIYANESVLGMLRRAESDIRKDLPGFAVDQLIGTNIDKFHKNPAHQRGLLPKLTTSMRSKLAIGGRNFNLVVSPVIDPRGVRLGTVVEWSDVTEQLAVEKEVEGIVALAVQGDFSSRLDLAGKSGFMLKLSEGVNGLLTTVAKALGDVKTVVGALAEGKLGSRMSTDYAGVLAQLSTDINSMGTRLSEIVGGIVTGSQTIANAAAEISQATDDLAGRTEQQAANLEETAAAMEEMTATVQKNAENAVQANTLVEEARSRASAGGAVVDKAVSAVDSIQKSSHEMAEIVNLIDDIAFQTNLLALNAAVEAARAGDAGKGFAVVATEVRSLAQRSGEAAKNIKDLIKTSNDHVVSGVRLVNETGESLKGIIESVTQIATIIQDVSGASREQATGLGEVNSAVSQMDEMTQQNAAMVEQTQAAAKSLADEAAHLSEQVSFFELPGGAPRAPAQPPRPVVQAAKPARPAAPVRPKPAPTVARPKAAIAAPRKALPKPAAPAAAPANGGNDDWKEF